MNFAAFWGKFCWKFAERFNCFMQNQKFCCLQVTEPDGVDDRQITAYPTLGLDLKVFCGGAGPDGFIMGCSGTTDMRMKIVNHFFKI